MSIAHVLFDLDGTLTDPAEGITQSIRHALRILGLLTPPNSDLVRYIGPPLRNTFAQLLGRNPGDAQVERAIGLYRERFSSVGLFENRLYPGVPEMLESLLEAGFGLYVATSKPQAFAVSICEHFGLHRYLSGIYGPELKGWFDDKGDLLAHLLSEEGIPAKDALMVGDREHDIMAAQKNGILSAGVTYGYGTREELKQAGATHICTSVVDIEMLLRKKLRKARPPRFI
jgi:phosphoglycolate phosphatase